MSPQDEKDLREIGGDVLVDLVKRQGEGRTKTLEPHVAHKEITDPIEQVQAVADVIGGDLKAVLLNAVKLLTEGKAKKAKPKKEEEETEVPEEFAEFMVEGTEDAEAEAVVEEEEEEPKAKAKAKAKKQVAAPQAPPQPVAEVKAEPSEAQITRAEIVDAMKEMGAQIRDEVIAATSESLKTLLTPFADEIAALKRADGEKIAEKAMQTPAASLTDLLRSARTRTEAAVKEGDPLLDRKPVEVAAQQNPAIAGMPPLIGAFITGADLRKS
jgi:type IV secretory pathway VirB10-like protein